MTVLDAAESARVSSLRLLAYPPHEARAEWIKRGAMLTASGAIVTHLNQNTKVFRDRMYAAIALGWVPPARKAQS